jgi:hypothetical protein
MINSTQKTLEIYYPFGSSMVSFSNTEFQYTFGMNTQEKDDEIYGAGNSYSAEYWQYDARLGRRWNVDPVVKEYESPYAPFANNPIWFVDYNGADSTVYLYSSPKTKNDGTELSPALSILELEKIRNEIKAINEKNGIYLKYEIVTPSQIKEIKQSITDFELNIKHTWDLDGKTGYGETNVNGTASEIWVDKIGGLARDNDIKKNSDSYYYLFGYLGAHEILHQMIIRSENEFGVKTTGNGGHNASSNFNLNTDGNWMMSNIEKGQVLNKFKASECVIHSQKILINNYFKIVEVKREISAVESNIWKFNEKLWDRNKLNNLYVKEYIIKQSPFIQH